MRGKYIFIFDTKKTVSPFEFNYNRKIINASTIYTAVKKFKDTYGDIKIDSLRTPDDKTYHSGDIIKSKAGLTITL